MSQKRVMMITYTILHFLVDFTTIFLVTNFLLGPSIGIVNRGYIIITYNLLAFAGQLPIGMISDAINKNRQLTALGCAMACISYPVALFSPWTACILAALGNGAFHIGAGSDVLKMSMPKAGLSGVFVSSGALGVWLAYKVSGTLIIIICPVVMLVLVLLLMLFGKDILTESDCVNEYKKPRLMILIAVVCFMLTIVIRSFLGMVMDFSWKAVPILSFVSVVAVMGGKALGGFLGDWFGYIKIAMISLIISAVAFMFAFDSWIAGIIAMLCFNITMPLTLTAIAGVCDKKYGFAFGLTTFALAIGFLPVVFGAKMFVGVPLFVSMVLISLILIVSGYIFIKNKTEMGESE